MYFNMLFNDFNLSDNVKKKSDLKISIIVRYYYSIIFLFFIIIIINLNLNNLYKKKTHPSGKYFLKY